MIRLVSVSCSAFLILGCANGQSVRKGTVGEGAPSLPATPVGSVPVAKRPPLSASKFAIANLPGWELAQTEAGDNYVFLVHGATGAILRISLQTAADKDPVILARQEAEAAVMMGRLVEPVEVFDASEGASLTWHGEMGGRAKTGLIAFHRWPGHQRPTYILEFSGYWPAAVQNAIIDDIFIFVMTTRLQ